MLTSRRSFFAMCGAIVLPGVSLGELIRTPWQGEGPFYPDRIPEDTDNDLVKNGYSTIEAGGNILNLMGSADSFTLRRAEAFCLGLVWKELYTAAVALN